MITTILLALHVFVCLVLILVVLLQTGKRADIAGAFGGGGSQTAFGARGAATFLSKATTWSAVIFMATSILLGVWFGRETGESVVREPDSGAAAPAPALPPPAQPPSGAPAPGEGQPPAPAGTDKAPSQAPEPPAKPVEGQAKPAGSK